MQHPLLDANVNHWQIREELNNELPKEGEVNVGRQGYSDNILQSSFQANSIAAIIRGNRVKIRKGNLVFDPLFLTIYTPWVET